MELKRNVDENLCEVITDKNMGIHNAEEFKKLLDDAFQNSTKIELDLNSLEDADIAFLQIVYSARKSSKRMNKVFEVRGDYPAFLMKLCETIGFPMWRDSYKTSESVALLKIWQAKNSRKNMQLSH